MRKFTSVFMVFIIIIFSNFNVFAGTNPPSVAADAAILLDGDTGEILYGKNINEAYPPASVTKIMTALLAFENCNLEDEVTVDSKSPMEDGSKIFIIEGEKIKVKYLLYGLILASGNDCAGALATHISGSPEKFALKMNERAKALGALNTNFVNPCGLYNVDHKTSAYDLSLIMKELSKHKEYLEISKTISYKIPPTNKQPLERPLWNENKLMQNYSKEYYSYALASKTGYTTESLFSYVAYARKDNRNLIVVILHEALKTYYGEAKALFEYGFNNFENEKLFSKGDIVSKIIIGDEEFPLISSSDFTYTKEKGEVEKPKLTLLEKDLKDVSFSKNEDILKASLMFKGKDVGIISLSSSKDHIINKPIDAVKKSFSFVKKALLIISSIFAVILILLLIIRFYRLHLRKRRWRNRYKNINKRRPY